MIKGFREFILRGNLVDLAVAFVLGAAFATVVNTFVSAIVKPIISAFPGASANGWGFSLRHTDGVPHGSTADALGKSTFIDFSAVLNAAIVFVITAAVVYFVFVVPMTKVRERRGEPANPPTTDELLTDIRDLLQQQAKR